MARNRRTLTVAVMAVAAVAGALLICDLVFGGDDGFVPAPGSHGPAAEISDAGRPATGPGRPNVVVISTDDQTLEAFNPKVMPRAYKLLAKQGTNFTDAIVVTPVCCPSRATYLTGDYGHNHGILTNNPGYPDLRRKASTLPVWMQQAGYRTVHIGKYLNNWSEQEDPTEPPPGWDDWRTELEPHGYYDYPLGINGKKVEFGHADKDYLTSVLTEEAVGAIDTYVPQKRPLFLTLDYFAPHNGRGRGDQRCHRAPVPAPEDQGLFKDARMPRSPSFNEKNVRDKPSFIQKLDRLKRPARRKLVSRYRCTLAALRGVDRGVKDVYDEVAKQGELDNTVFVFWSDNGFFNGEHRLSDKKQLHYEEGLRIPLAIRVGSDVERHGHLKNRVDSPVANLDLAPTILDYAGGTPCKGKRCREMDGLSARNLIRGRKSRIRPNRPLLIEFKNHPRSRFTCAYQGVRTPHKVYVEHVSIPDPETNECHPAHEVELYDLDADPYELKNELGPGRPSKQATKDESRLARELNRLRDCRGVRGRDRKAHGRAFCA